MAVTLETLLESERKGYGNQPDLRLVVTLEQHSCARYVQLALLKEGLGAAHRKVTIRQRELDGIIAALRMAQERICDGDGTFTQGMSIEVYAASEACPIT